MTSTLTVGGVGADGQWRELADGADVTLVAGAQGGFHVWLRYRVDGLAAGTQRLERTAHRVSDGQLVLRSTGEVTVQPGSDGAFEPADPIPMFMCPSPIGLSVIDQPIVFRIAFPDEQLARELTLVPHCPTDGSRDFCMRICTG